MHPNASLAAERRRRLLAQLGQDVGVVVAFHPVNKAYLSGYHSMTHDVAPFYRSAAVATGNDLSLVVSAADAGPALEVIGDPARIVRYGQFWFRDVEGTLGFDSPGHADFGTALRATLTTVEGTGVTATDDPAQASALGLEARDMSDALRRARMIKLPAEIEHLRQAARIVEKAIKRVRAEARAGMTEHAIAGMIAEVIVAGGAVPRFISVTTGPRSALADAYPTHRAIQPGDLVRLDIGCSLNGYWADIGRTLVVGEPSDRQRIRHDAIVAGLRAALDTLRAGTRVAEVFHAGVDATRRAGIPTYERHHCGHGIGLEGYEFPLVTAQEDAVLKAGMVLCVETPFYEIGWGGMMVEDMIVVTTSGYESLSALDHALSVIPA